MNFLKVTKQLFGLLSLALLLTALAAGPTEAAGSRMLLAPIGAPVPAPAPAPAESYVWHEVLAPVQAPSAAIAPQVPPLPVLPKPYVYIP